jgi:hypothetical protein
MSARYGWDPVVRKKSGSFGVAMASALAKRIHGGTGDIQGHELSEADIPWLTGVRDSSDGEISRDAGLLLDAIERYGTIELTVDY